MSTAPDYLAHDGLCQHRRSQGLLTCDCPLGRPRPEPRPVMISFDMASGTTTTIIRCCENPAPGCSEPVRNKNGKPGTAGRPWQCDLTCSSCGTTLAVMRWRL